MVKNSTKYKFVPLFKQIKLSREMVKAFDEYASAGFLACAFSLDLRPFLSVCLVPLVLFMEKDPRVQPSEIPYCARQYSQN